MPNKSDPVATAMQMVAEHFEVSVADIRSLRRSSSVHAARTWGMYLARETACASFEEIAEQFRRDHMFVRAVIRNRARDVSDDARSAQLFTALKSRVLPS